jgi:hypothetical protein
VPLLLLHDVNKSSGSIFFAKKTSIRGRCAGLSLYTLAFVGSDLTATTRVPRAGYATSRLGDTCNLFRVKAG